MGVITWSSDGGNDGGVDGCSDEEVIMVVVMEGLLVLKVMV